MAASNPNQMESAQAQVQEVVGVMRNNIDKVSMRRIPLIMIMMIMRSTFIMVMRNNIDKVSLMVILRSILMITMIVIIMIVMGRNLLIMVLMVLMIFIMSDDMNRF